MESAGWKIEVETNNLDWWADEVWILLQNQLAQPVYLAFIVDAMFDGVRNKGEHVEAVSASHDILRSSSTRSSSLRRGWRTHLDAFIQSIHEMATVEPDYIETT